MRLKGKGASPGTALAPVFVLKAQEFRFSELKNFESGRENLRWKIALRAVLNDLTALKEKFQMSGPKESVEILEAHKMMAEDPEWTSMIEDLIGQGHQCEYSVHIASENFAKMIDALGDPYLSQRANDIRDVAKRLLQALDSQMNLQVDLKKNFVLVAEDLLPSELLNFHSEFLKGVVLQKGNPTSHTTILTRTFEIPLVIKVADLMSHARTGDELAIDGLKGSIEINPGPEEKFAIEKQIQKEKQDLEELSQFIHTESRTIDGVRIEVAANLNSVMDLDFALRKGTEGVGLFRTEFLLMDRKQSPTEEEQFLAYKKVVESVAPHRAVIRTFDIGGDKQVEFLKLPIEDNPFLGCRGVRFCLREKEFFKTQLRALLRASQFGRLGIMIPMVGRLEEVLEFKFLLEESTKELQSKGKSFDAKPEVGIMIEVPSAALIADQLAPHLDFMSIGTNDLVQYLCAADRMNSVVADLHDTYHPGLLRLLKIITDSVAPRMKEKRLWLGMCGELAAQEDYLPLLLALGFSELSVSPGAILRTRKKLLVSKHKDTGSILEKALKAGSSDELRAILQKNLSH